MSAMMRSAADSPSLDLRASSSGIAAMVSSPTTTITIMSSTNVNARRAPSRWFLIRSPPVLARQSCCRRGLRPRPTVSRLIGISDHNLDRLRLHVLQDPAEQLVRPALLFQDLLPLFARVRYLRLGGTDPGCRRSR